MKKCLKTVVFILLVGVFAIMVPVLGYAANGMTLSEWNDFYSTCGNNETGMHMFADASCKNPLDPNYISVDLNIEKLAEEPVDAWIAMGFVKSYDDPMNLVSGTPEGINLMMKNSGGKLSLFVCKNGVGNPLMDLVKLDSINAIGDLSFKFMRDESNNTWHLYINDQRIDADDNVFSGVNVSDFTDSNGKTYVAFAAYDNTGEALNNRVWTVNNITDKDPQKATGNGDKQENTVADSGKNPATSDGGIALYLILSVVSLSILALVIRKRISCANS